MSKGVWFVPKKKSWQLCYCVIIYCELALNTEFIIQSQYNYGGCL